MARTRIALTQAAYDRLKKQKLPGESFSDVVLREIPVSCKTAGEILDYFETHPVPKANPKMRSALLGRRGARTQSGSRNRKAERRVDTRRD